jgi:hypothetical protein
MNCTFIPRKTLEQLKTYQDGINLFYKYGKDISKIPNKYKINFLDAKNAKELVKSFAGNINFDENELFASRYLDYGISYDASKDSYSITIGKTKYDLPKLQGNSNEDFGIYLQGKTPVLSNFAKDELLETHKQDIPHFSNVIADIYKFASIQEAIDRQEDLLKQEDDATTRDNIQKVILDLVDEKNTEILNIQSKYPNFKFPLSYFSDTLSKTISHYGRLVDFEVVDIPHEDLEDFIILKEKHTNKLLVLHAYAGYRYANSNSNDRMGQGFMPLQELNKVQTLATTSDTISLKMYLANARLVELGYDVIDVVSSSYYYSKDLDIPPLLVLDAPAFHQSIKPVFEYFIKTAPHQQSIAELYAGHRKLEKKNTLSNNIVERRKTISIYLPQNELAEIDKYIASNDLAGLKKYLFSLLKSKRKRIMSGEGKAELTALYELIQAVREENVGEKLKERNTDDASLISSFINDASNIDNYYIQTVMTIIREKIFQVKQTLLPFSNKANQLVKKIIDEQTHYLHKVSFFPKGHTFFNNLISSDGRYSGLYIYVDPNEFEGAWANSKENKAGWNRLTQAEKEFSTFFVKQLKESYEGVYGEEAYSANWEDGRIPLMKKDISLQTAEILNQAKDKDFKSAFDNVKDVMERAFGANENFAQVVSETGDTGVPNYYMRGNNEEHEEYARELVLKYGGIETDLYKVLLATKSNLEKKKEFDEIEGYFQLIKHMASRDVSTDGITENKNTLKLLDNIYKYYFKQERQKLNAGNRKYKNYASLRKVLKNIEYVDVDKIINMGMKFNTFVTMVLNPLNDIKNVTQGFLRGLARGVAGTLSNLYGNDAPFTVSDFIRQWALATSLLFDVNRRDVVAQLLKVTNTFNADLSDFANPKFLETDKRFVMFRSGAFFMLNFLGDYVNRSAVTLAMIEKEIGLEAFSLDKNGSLVYDKTKDKRYQTPDGKIIVDALIDNGYIYGIDDKMSSYYKKVSNETYGAYDNETFRMINMYALGRLLLQFRRYLPDYLYESFAKGKYVYNTGKYVVKNGKVVWEGTYEEGVMRSLISMFNPRVLREVLRESQTLDADVVSRKRLNLAKFTSDIALFISLYLLYSILNGDFDDDDDEKKSKIWFLGNKTNTQAFRSLIFDSVQTINLNTYQALFKTPFLITTKLSKLVGVLNNLTLAAQYGVLGNEKKASRKAYKALDDFGDVVPVWNSAKKIKEQTQDILWSDVDETD